MTSFQTPVEELVEPQFIVPAMVVNEAVGELAHKTQEGQDRAHLNLPIALRPRDVTTIFILVVLSVFGASQVRAAGTASLLYWLLGFCTFLLPSAYVTHWLSSRFPGQGGHYLWAKRIMGTHWAFIAAFSAWLPCVFAVISTLANCLILIENTLPIQRFNNVFLPAICLLFIMLIAAIVTCLPLRWLKYGLFVVTALYVAIPIFIGAAGVWWLLTGHHSMNAWLSPFSWHISISSVTNYRLVILLMLGVNLPTFLNGKIRDKAGSHVRNRGRVGRFLLLGAIIVGLAYLVQAWSIAIVIPTSQESPIPSNIHVVQIVFGHLAGAIIFYMLVFSQIAAISAYLLIASRILLLLAHDRRLPASLTILNKHGVPVRSIVAQSIMIVVLAVPALLGLPLLLQDEIDPTILAGAIYTVLQSSISFLLIFSTVQLFVFALRCLFRLPEKRTQGAMRGNRRGLLVMRHVQQRKLLLAASVLGLVASLFGIWGTLMPSVVPKLLDKKDYALLVIGVAVISLGIAWVICEVMRTHSLLREQRHLNDREITLRSQLQEANHELEISVAQQNELIFEVGRLYREQAQAAVTDSITGLPNHRAIMSRIDEEIARCERVQSQCAILFVDIDHFKRVNDTWGHRAGDTILREVATRLQMTLRLSDVVGRYGGEEFALLLPETDIVGASETAERLRLAIASEPCIWQSEDGSSNIAIPITASIGVAAYGMHGTSREKLVESADQAMYRAKQGGRNRVCVADLEEQQEHLLLVALPPQVESTAVQVLTAAAYARDRGTDDHAHRMVALAETTAREMHMSDEEIHLVRLGALLHDIGKIGIPDVVLHKPGPLTSEEWDIMRMHPEIGQRILSQAGGAFIALADIVVAHHERWDGHGYPRELAGNAIPLAARILTVIDSYDAMTSRRVYRAAMSPLLARDELQRCAGTQYDPAVVAAFLHVLDTHDILGALLIPLAPKSLVESSF